MPKATCFVIMPFRAELHYMYLYMKRHLEVTYDMQVGRGDSKVMTVTVLEKIRRYIEDADIVIADCTGRNPNVFYELGMAHVLNKSVVLITSDPVEQAPTDIKAYEFIRYTTDHEAFVAKLDSVMQGLIGGGYDELFEAVEALFDRFRADTGLNPNTANKDDFIRMAASRARGRALPSVGDKAAIAKFLPDIIAPPVDIDLMSTLKNWISQ